MAKSIVSTLVCYGFDCYVRVLPKSTSSSSSNIPAFIFYFGSSFSTGAGFFFMPGRPRPIIAANEFLKSSFLLSVIGARPPPPEEVLMAAESFFIGLNGLIFSTLL